MAERSSLDWRHLSHAYGTAEDIPALLDAIEAFPAETDWQAEPWFSLWSALYHQGDIYPASIAAVPRIVSTLAREPTKVTLSFFLLPASIAVADNARQLDVPAEMRERFENGLSELGGLASSALLTVTDQHIAKAARAAVLVAQRQFEQAGDLLDADAP